MKSSLTKLKWFDIAILTFILFSHAIYSSFMYYLTPAEEENATALTSFSAQDNLNALLLQSVLLSVALLYLKWRHFQFSSWHLKPSLKGIGTGVLFFIIAALYMDLYFILLDSVVDVAYSEEGLNTESLQTFAWLNLPLIPYAMLNGFYEEIFFLGICLSVNQKYLPIAFIYSLIIRFSFHTYQGMETAIGIGFVLGSVFFLLYQKSKQKALFPFFIAHAIADVFGAGLLSYFY
ncbi:CPBP family intramembrane glutamic endopeptidase [Bisgaard Taxon 45]